MILSSATCRYMNSLKRQYKYDADISVSSTKIGDNYEQGNWRNAPANTGENEGQRACLYNEDTSQQPISAKILPSHENISNNQAKINQIISIMSSRYSKKRSGSAGILIASNDEKCNKSMNWQALTCRMPVKRHFSTSAHITSLLLTTQNEACGLRNIYVKYRAKGDDGCWQYDNAAPSAKTSCRRPEI